MLDYDIRHGRTYMYFAGEPLYSFGHGLSYTTFGYGDLRVDAESLPADGAVNVSVDVTNTGEGAGDEVVQMYVSHLDSLVAHPLQELKGFSRIYLRPGETRTVTMPLSGADVAYWDDPRVAGLWRTTASRSGLEPPLPVSHRPPGSAWSDNRSATYGVREGTTPRGRRTEKPPTQGRLLSVNIWLYGPEHDPSRADLSNSRTSLLSQ